MRPQVGQVINNKYRLLRLIGDGGMGSVYEARHEVLGTSVALKFLHKELATRQGLVQRFLQEARVSAQIQSPHVVRVTDVDQTPAAAFIVMEYIEGRTLQTLYEDFYRAGQRLPYSDALEFAMQMLEGVEAAHKTGIVHRDLKPDNVMITHDAKGRPVIKLLDFGIAKLFTGGEFDRKLTRPGVIMGTPEYMAPEQAYSADNVDARADIFSLGVIIFEMIAGRRPVGGEEPQQIAAAYLSGQVAQITDLAPEVAPDLADAVQRAMAPLPSGRWPTVTAFRDAIEPFAAQVRAPSALPLAPSLSNPGITPQPAMASPATASHAGLDSPRPVPRTLPPESAAAQGNGAADRRSSVASALPSQKNGAASDPGGKPFDEKTNPAEPPEMSERGPTPIGGFAAQAWDTAPSAKFDPGPDPPAAGRFPATTSAAPYVPEAVAPPVAADPAATAFATPLAPLPDASLTPKPRVSVEPAAPARPSGTALGEHGFGGPAFSAEGDLAGTAPSLPTPQGLAPRVAPPPRKSVVNSLPAILLLAAGVSAAVVGGVYLAQNQAKLDDHENPPAPPPAASVRSDPPPESDPPAPTPTATPAPTLFKPLPLKSPPPKGSGTPVGPQPVPSGTPSGRPGLPFPPIIPSNFPFPLPLDLPFGPPGEPPRSRPDRPPPRGNPDDPGPPRRQRGAEDPRWGERPPPRGQRPPPGEPPPDSFR
jgi:serine/threonine-protein kinase